MSAETVEVRVGKGKALGLNLHGQLRQYLTGKGLDPTKPMECREDGEHLVYSGWPVTKGHALTDDNRKGGR